MILPAKEKHICYESVPPVDWEYVPCNLCGRDDTELYHLERLPYFEEVLDFEIVRCRHCSLVYTNPRLSDHNATYLLASSDDTDQIEQHAAAKATVFETALDEIISLQAEQDRRTPGTLLDVGCGSGHFLARAQKRGFDVTGIEPVKIAADYAANVLHMPVIQQDILQSELTPNSFDVITAWDVIEHVNDPRAVLAQCVKWLKPGGIMALRFPSSTWQKIKGAILHGLLSSSRAVFSSTMHLYFFNEQTFTTMAHDVGLEVIHTKTTPAESNTGSTIFDGIKVISNHVLRTMESLSSKHFGNLEVYCRKNDLSS